ncbi:MAG TPA: tetratricopeptide repeat protein [Blastocatellia bacterium]|nr:tetratricopeptide repeat protein [Blastocatellia bacterium]
MFTMLKRTALLAALTMLLALAASAQTAQIEGTIKLKAADGSAKPLPGAQVDIYRTDIKGSYPVKADKNGRYIRLGIPVQGTYIFVVSGPGAAPTWQTGIKVSQVPVLDFTLDPGDGTVPTYEQVLAAMKGSGVSPTSAAPQPSAADRAKAEAANKERAEKNKETQALQANLDEAIKHFKAGAELKTANNYEGAIAEFEQAAAVDPGKHKAFVEVAHKSNAQLAETHYQLGADLFNKKQKDVAKTHFQKGYESAKRAIAFGAQVPATDDANINNELLIYYGILAKNAALLVEMYSDTTVIDDTVKAIDQAETLDTPANKGKWDVMKAKMYFNSGRTDEATAAYKAILATDPNNVDALFGLGLTLVATGEKAKVQEGANYLADFVAKAPPTDKHVAEVKAVLDDLKKQQQVEPEKPARRRRP